MALGAFIIKDNIQNKSDTDGLNGILTFQTGQIIAFLISIFTIEIYLRDVFDFLKLLSESISGTKNFYELDKADKIKAEFLKQSIAASKANLVKVPNTNLENNDIIPSIDFENFKITDLSFVDVSFNYQKLSEKETSNNENIECANNNDNDLNQNNNYDQAVKNEDNGYQAQDWDIDGINIDSPRKKLKFNVDMEKVKYILSPVKKKREIQIITKNSKEDISLN